MKMDENQNLFSQKKFSATKNRKRKFDQWTYTNSIYFVRGG